MKSTLQNFASSSCLLRAGASAWEVGKSRSLARAPLLSSFAAGWQTWERRYDIADLQSAKHPINFRFAVQKTAVSNRRSQRPGCQPGSPTGDSGPGFARSGSSFCDSWRGLLWDGGSFTASGRSSVSSACGFGATGFSCPPSGGGLRVSARRFTRTAAGLHHSAPGAFQRGTRRSQTAASLAGTAPEPMRMLARFTQTGASFAPIASAPTEKTGVRRSSFHQKLKTNHE